MKRKMKSRSRLKKLLGKAVCVAWVDACSEPGWEERKEIVTLEECETLGWLISFDTTTVNVAQSRSGLKTTEVLAIPRTTVKAIRRVR